MAKKVAGNVGITHDSNALDGYLNTSSMSAVVNAIQTTNFDSTGELSIAGLPTWTVSVGGPWDGTLDGYIGPNLISPPTTLHTLAVAIDTVTYTWTSNTFFNNYTIDASSPAEGITWSGELTCSGVPTRS